MSNLTTLVINLDFKSTFRKSKSTEETNDITIKPCLPIFGSVSAREAVTLSPPITPSQVPVPMTKEIIDVPPGPQQGQRPPSPQQPGPRPAQPSVNGAKGPKGPPLRKWS